MPAKRELFGDGSGSAVAALGTVPWTNAATTTPVTTDSEIVAVATVVDSATAIELSVQVSPPGQNDWQDAVITRPVSGSEDTVFQEPLVVRIDGSAGIHPLVIPVPTHVDVRLRARRVGGKISTSLYVEGFLREVLGNASVALWQGLSGTSDVNLDTVSGESVASTSTTGALPTEDVDYESSATAQIFDDGSGIAKAISDGSWTDTDGTEWHSSGRSSLMTVYMTMTVNGAETTLQMRIRERIITAGSEYLQLATNQVVAGEEDVDAHVIDLPLSAGKWVYRFPVDPGREYAIDYYQEDGAPTADSLVSFSR